MLTRILEAPALLPVINCGSGQAVPILDLAHAVIRAARQGTITHADARINEISSFTADMDLFHRAYGAIARTPLDEALALSIQTRAPALTTA